MIRTRDVFLFVVIVVFLLVGIGKTLIDRYATPATVAAPTVKFVDSELVSLEAVAPEGVAATRDERIRSLRQKIAAGVELTLSEGEPDQVPAIAAPAEMVLQCPNYNRFSTFWDASTLVFETVEGARVLYSDQAIQSSTSPEAVIRTEVAVLPMSPIITPTPQCLSSDVIGLTLTGELIRNNSSPFTGVAETALIGYALDGFPIFGVTEAERDQCGGVTVNGLYRYQVSLESAAILNCFVATPATL